MATRYDQFAKVRRKYSNQAQLRTPAISPTLAARSTSTVVTSQYSGYSASRTRGSWQGGYSIP